MPPKIVLVEDHRLVRDGLRALLEKEGLDVVAEAGDGRTALQVVAELRPDIVIMDVGLPHLNGIEATRQIVAGNPRIRVIALSMHGDTQSVAATLRAGASAYLLIKDCAADELMRAVRSVTARRTFLGSGVADALVHDYLRLLSREDSSPLAMLTAREREVLQLVAEGNSTKDIAGALHVSIKTVETFRRQIMDKLEIRSVAGLTKYAIRAGLTSLG